MRKDTANVQHVFNVPLHSIHLDSRSEPFAFLVICINASGRLIVMAN